MKVILLEEVKGKGGEGDVVDVATGFAVNFLLPKKLAVAATPGNLKQLEQRRHNIARREAERLDTADKVLTALEGRVIKIATKVGEEGQLFGSVTAQQIADNLKEVHGINIDRKVIDTHGLIKTIGEHEVSVGIYRDVKATVKVVVVDEKVAAAEAAAGAAGKDATETADAVEAEVVAEFEAELAAEAVAEAEVAEAEVAEAVETDTVAE